MQQNILKPRYYTVKEIKQLEHCGKDKAYSLAKQLEHEKRGRDIYVFADSYEEYYESKRKQAKIKKDNVEETKQYKIRRFK